MSLTVGLYKPFVSVLKSNEKTLKCDLCFKSLRGSGVECSHCHKYWYCNEFCRNNDSMVHHFECDPSFDLKQLIVEKCSSPEVREECDWIKFKDSDEFVTQTLLLLRILFRLKSDPKSATVVHHLPNDLFASYDDIVVPISRTMRTLWNESNDREDKEEEDFRTVLIDDYSYNFSAWLSVVTQVLDSNFLRNKLGSVSEEVLMKAFRLVIRYTIYVCDMSFLKEIGKAIYVEMCFITHSCLPNCGPLFQDSNVLNLRLLSEGLTDFSQLKYDFQIEMTAYSAQLLSESLRIRNISCFCQKCSNPLKFCLDYRKNIIDSNIKYGNLPLLEYCLALSVPIDEALDYMTRTHGQNHPLITGLLLWKFTNEWNLFNSEEFKDTTRAHIFNTFKRLKNAIRVTHGSDHIWYLNMNAMEEQFSQLIQSINSLDINFKFIEERVQQIILNSVFDKKFA